MKFLGKWVELENVILNEATQSHMECTHCLADISPEAWNTQEIIHLSNDDQEEGRNAPWFWKGSVQQCRVIPGQGNGKGVMGDRGRNQGLWDIREW